MEAAIANHLSRYDTRNLTSIDPGSWFSQRVTPRSRRMSAGSCPGTPRATAPFLAPRRAVSTSGGSDLGCRRGPEESAPRGYLFHCYPPPARRSSGPTKQKDSGASPKWEEGAGYAYRNAGETSAMVPVHEGHQTALYATAGPPNGPSCLTHGLQIPRRRGTSPQNHANSGIEVCTGYPVSGGLSVSALAAHQPGWPLSNGPIPYISPPAQRRSSRRYSDAETLSGYDLSENSDYAIAARAARAAQLARSSSRRHRFSAGENTQVSHDHPQAWPLRTSMRFAAAPVHKSSFERLTDRPPTVGRRSFSFPFRKLSLQRESSADEVMKRRDTVAEGIDEFVPVRKGWRKGSINERVDYGTLGVAIPMRRPSRRASDSLPPGSQTRFPAANAMERGRPVFAQAPVWEDDEYDDEFPARGPLVVTNAQPGDDCYVPPPSRIPVPTRYRVLRRKTQEPNLRVRALEVTTISASPIARQISFPALAPVSEFSREELHAPPSSHVARQTLVRRRLQACGAEARLCELQRHGNQLRALLSNKDADLQTVKGWLDDCEKLVRMRAHMSNGGDVEAWDPFMALMMRLEQEADTLRNNVPHAFVG